MTIKCGACGSENVSGQHNYSSFETHVRVKPEDAGWLNIGSAVKPEKARICRECGHVMLFISPAELSRHSDSL